MFEQLEGDETVIKILIWKGTGEKRKFIDVLTEHVNKNLQWVDDIFEDKPSSESPPWLYDYIVQNNFQLEFDPDDIVLRHPHKAI